MKSTNSKNKPKSRHMGSMAAFVDDFNSFMEPRQLELAKTIVGVTPRKRLAWALRFAQQDPGELTAGELLDDRIRLEAFNHPDDAGDSPVQLVFLLDAASVAAVRREIAGMLLPLKPNQIREGKKIELIWNVSCTEADGPPVVWFESRTGGAVTGFVHLLNEYRTELRRCEDPKCRHWFIGRPNKHFCSTTCLSRVTTEKSRKGGK